MKKMIIIERSRFARLLRNYRKSLYMNTLLTHICKQRRTLLTLTAEEICELLQLDPEEVRRRTLRGRLRYDEIDGIRYYDLIDLIDLKDSLDSQLIFRQTMDSAVPDTAIQDRKSVV